MTVDWEIFNKKLETIKYPHVLIFKFFNSIHLLSDNIASIMLRFIIKYEIEDITLSVNCLTIFILNAFLYCTPLPVF